jgi:hypothetical protein
LAVTGPSPAQTGRPAFVVGPNAAIAIANAEVLPVIRTAQSRNITLSNGNATFEFGDIPPDLQLPYEAAAAVTIGSSYSSSSPLLLTFKQSGSLTVTDGWGGSDIPGIQTNGNVLDLSLPSPAAFRYIDGSKFSISPESLKFMEFANIRKSDVYVTSAQSISEFLFNSDSLVVRNITTVDRSQFTGLLTIVLDIPIDFRADLGSGVPPNTSLKLNPGMNVILSREFSQVASDNKILIVGVDSIVWYEGDTPPSVIDVQGDNISLLPRASNITATGTTIMTPIMTAIMTPITTSIMTPMTTPISTPGPVSTPTRTPKDAGLSTGSIVMVALASTVLVGVVVFVVVIICQKKGKKMADYDKFPEYNRFDDGDMAGDRSTSFINL